MSQLNFGGPAPSNLLGFPFSLWQGISMKFIAALLSIALFCGMLNADELSEKIAQMFIVGFDGGSFSEGSLVAKAIKEQKVGGLIFFALEGRNINDPGQLKQFTIDIKAYAKEHNPTLLLAIDVEGGWVDRLSPRQGFKHRVIMAKALGELNDPQFTYEYAQELAALLEEYGFNMNFAPVVDLDVNPVSPAIGGLGRSFSKDPNVVASQAKAFIKAFQEKRILTSLKHFPGHGSATTDSHNGLTDVTYTWQAEELEPYRQLVGSGYSDLVMVGHVVNRNLDNTTILTMAGEPSVVPATLSKKMIGGILRDDIGFQGAVISDDMTMGAIADLYDFRTALKNGINAGVDVFILANHHGKDQTAEAIALVYNLVEKGDIPKSRIDEAYERIMKMKTRM